MIAAAPTPASTSGNVPLPPSGRDFDVYRRTAVEGRTTREVAAEFNLSQTRVLQLRDRVFEWMATHLPASARFSPAERLRVAETLAWEQLLSQYDEAMEAWRKSQSAVHTTRYIGRAIEDGVTVVKASQGEPKYLRLATQISKAIAKQKLALMPDPETAVAAIKLHATIESEDPASGTPECAGETSLEVATDYNLAPPVHRETYVSRSPALDVANHPQGDCSNLAVAEEVPNGPMAASEAATAGNRPASATTDARKSATFAPKTDETETVQTVLERLDNVSQKSRKMRKREQRLMRDLIRERRPEAELLTSLVGGRAMSAPK